MKFRPLDEVVVASLVDNVYDGLLGGPETITRAPVAARMAHAPQFEFRSTQVGPTADSVLITGDVDRTTKFERGMPPAHQRWSNWTWEPNPLLLDDQALVLHVRGKDPGRSDRKRTCRRGE